MKTGNIMRRHETGGADLGPGVRVIFCSAGANRPGVIEDAPRRLSPAGFLLQRDVERSRSRGEAPMTHWRPKGPPPASTAAPRKEQP